MVICPNPDCQHANPAENLICDRCKTPLHEVFGETQFDVISRTQVMDMLNRAASRPVDTATFGPNDVLVIVFRDYPDERLELDLVDEVVLGRQDPEDPAARPDVDLAPFDAKERGISRRHAVLRRAGNKLTLIDLNSTNRTLINGRPLLPLRPQYVRAGDEIALGQLVMYLNFEQPS